MSHARPALACRLAGAPAAQGLRIGAGAGQAVSRRRTMPVFCLIPFSGLTLLNAMSGTAA